MKHLSLTLAIWAATSFFFPTLLAHRLAYAQTLSPALHFWPYRNGSAMSGLNLLNVLWRIVLRQRDKNDLHYHPSKPAAGDLSEQIRHLLVLGERWDKRSMFLLQKIKCPRQKSLLAAARMFG
jgi:putative solute:sodium symporter small subunit